jgi:transglutaminase-like putative cysteine protease
MTRMFQSSAPAPAVRRYRYFDNLYFQDGQWMTVVLASLLYLLVAAALDAAGHIENLSVVMPVTLGALALGIFMSFSRFDGFFALSHSMFTGLAWILFVLAATVTPEQIKPFVDNGIGDLQARVYFILLRLLDWVDAALNNSASSDNYVFMFEICFLMWWLTYLGIWSILRYGYTWRAVIPAGAVLMVNTFYAPRSTLGFLIVFALIALLLLVRTNLAEHQLRWRVQRLYFNQDLVFDFLRIGLLFSLVVVALAWAAPGLGRNPQVRALLAPINQGWEQTQGQFQRLYQGLNRQSSSDISPFGDNLSLGGARNTGDALLFEARATQARYWRAVAFDTFNGRGWQNSVTAERAFDPGEIVPIPIWRARTAISQTITLLASVGDVVFGASDVAQATLRLTAQVNAVPGAFPITVANPQPGDPALEMVLARADEPLKQGDSYVMVSAVTNASERDLRSVPAAYPAQIADRYLQLPPGFSPRVAALAQELTAAALTPYDKAKAVESYLRTIPYNDEIAAPPAGADPIEYFLFDLREGYCDYYATAMAMMLRSVGVPARAVSGYAEGTFDEESGAWFITQRDAHTSVEVFFPDYGWIEFEPTAAESPLERPAGEEPAAGEDSSTITNEPDAEPTPPANGEDPNAVPTPVGEPTPPPFTGEDSLLSEGLQAAAESTPWWAWALGVGAMLLVGGYLVWRTRTQASAGFIADQPMLIYDRLERWAQRLGHGPGESETPLEHIRRLALAVPEGAAEIRLLATRYLHYRFAGRTGQSGVIADPEMAAAWSRLQPMLWRAWWRRQREKIIKPRPDAFQLHDSGAG